jgi:hypothetical protein
VSRNGAHNEKAEVEMKILRAVLSICLLQLGVVAVPAEPLSPLHLLVSVPQEIGTVYIAPPKQPATNLLLIGEPTILQLQISVLNDSESSREMISLRRTVDIAVHAFPDRRVVTVPRSEASSAVRVFATGQVPVQWSARMALAPHEQLRWTMPVDLSAVSPGIYLIEVLIAATDDNGLPMTRWAPGMYVEIRDDHSAEAAKEIAVRAAVRLNMADRQLDALDAALRAVAQYPNSVAAYNVLGDIYDDLHRVADATTSYSHAVDLIASNADHPFIPLRPEDVREMVSRLKLKIAHTQ